MIKGRKLVRGFLAGVLAVSFVMNAGAANNIRDAKDKKKEVEQQRDHAQAEQKSAAERVRAISASMKQTEEKLGAKRAAIEEAEEELVMKKVEENEQYESMKLRIQYMYENGSIDFMQLFLESKSIGDFLNKAEYIAKLSEYDRNKLSEYRLAVNAVEEKEATLQAEYKELEKLQDSLAAQRKEAETLLAQKRSELAKLDDELKAIKTQIANAEAEENRKPQNPSSEKQEEAQEPVITGNGFFCHPCPGMSYQSSDFEEVRQGIGDTRPHKGHDYAARAGTPVYAAAAGTVLIAGWSDSAGNWVVISHGNGLVTKYMHMYRTPLVKAGQKVVKGQHIGGVGTTGQSTGNHLHFQVELNGTAVNPSLYM